MSKVQFTTAHGQLYRSWKVSPILFQTDLRITDHRNTNFHRQLRSFPFKTRIEWPPGWPQSQVFRAYFSPPAIFRATSKLFGLLGWSNDKNWLDFSSIFFKNCRFRSSILASLFHSTRSDTRVKFDSGVIYLNQSQFFANAQQPMESLHFV